MKQCWSRSLPISFELEELLNVYSYFWVKGWGKGWVWNYPSLLTQYCKIKTSEKQFQELWAENWREANCSSCCQKRQLQTLSVAVKCSWQFSLWCCSTRSPFHGARPHWSQHFFSGVFTTSLEKDKLPFPPVFWFSIVTKGGDSPTIRHTLSPARSVGQLPFLCWVLAMWVCTGMSKRQPQGLWKVAADGETAGAAKGCDFAVQAVCNTSLRCSCSCNYLPDTAACGTGLQAALCNWPGLESKDIPQSHFKNRTGKPIALHWSCA